MRPGVAVAVAVLVGASTLTPAEAVTEPLDDALSRALAAANLAERQLTVVLMKDRQFMPPQVYIRSGGSVLFIWADSEKREHHSPQSSGSTGSATTDLSGAYVPPNPEACYSASRDLHVNDMVGEGSSYPLTLTFTPATQQIRKAMGVFAGTPVGDLTYTPPLTPCPSGTHSLLNGQAVVPYHCKVHGKDFSGDQGKMKGAIIVIP